MSFSVTTNIPNGSVYMSDPSPSVGDTITLYARPLSDYIFAQWSDGDTDNPRTYIVEDVSLVAEYQRPLDTNAIYQYRCYVKDQLDLTSAPKAFMIVETTNIKRDLMTNAVTSLTVKEIATNINEGDVLVIYDPFGTNLYSGVITSIEDKQIRCSQMQSFYKGLWIYNVSPQDYLEHEIAVLLQNYADGKIYRSTYIDPLVALRLGGITIDYVGATTVKLPTDLDKDNNEQLTQKDMEKWMYELYETYGIIFDFEINFSGANYVTIKVPTYTKIKVGDNMFAIKDVSPITEIEETNRLIIFNENKVYRTTYVATKTNIVEAPASTATRFNITNTKVVFSKDAVADLVAANLPDQMYNHKLTFTLVIKNFIYQFGDFNLGGGLDVFNGDDYYDTVLTGYEFKKEDNRNITEVYFTCGKVRNKLTQLITLSKV